ncbi:MAG TPA: response regulator, partial [Myxococcaceae bacterium]|nr:response regulator [Myxococcaceae bacterium]
MPKSLLVADDSLTIRKVIGMVFSTEDVQITAVDNGLDAIAKARELRPDLVLADV